MARIALTGAGGELAVDLASVLARRGHRVIPFDRERLDVLDRRQCARRMRACGAEVVIDCSAPEDTRRGAENVARAAARAGALSVYLSCAEVFDGTKSEPYVESDAPSPLEEAGAAKLEAERAMALANPRHTIVRSSWLFGTRAANLVSCLLVAARESDRIEVDASVRSSPTYTGHLAEGLAELVARPVYGVVHLAAGQSCTRLRLARMLCRMAHIDCDPVPAGGVVAPRPVNLMLATRRQGVPLLPDWRRGLRAYLDELERARMPAE